MIIVKRLLLLSVTLCLTLFAAISSQADVIESATESFTGSRQGDVTLVSSPVRAGSRAFRHSISNTQERAEFEMGKNTRIGGTYWYGLSYFLPSNFPTGSGIDGGFTLIAQFAAYPSANNWPCRGVGSHILLGSGEGRGQAGKMTFVLQKRPEGGSVSCQQFTVEDIDNMKNRWTDVVMHVKWTGNSDGFLKLWMRLGDGTWVQKIDYKGATFANNEGTGPYTKFGAYVGNPGRGSRLLYTDEYRLGDANSSFNDVAPGGGSGGGSTPTPTPVTPTPTPTPTPGPGCNIASAGNSWINNSFVNQTSSFTATFDAKPSTSPSNMHIGLSSGAQSGYSGYAAIVRFNTAGNIDARNGGSYSAASSIPYSANTNYKFRLVVNIPAHTYSVYVTPAGGSEVAVGEKFAFRTEQATISQLNNWGAFTDASSGSLQVCNFQIGGGVPTTLINETFDSSASNFTTSGGTWNVSGGQYRLTDPNTSTSTGNGNLAIHNTGVTGDFILTVDGTAVASSSMWNDFSVVFGYVDTQNYYFASFNEGNDDNTNGLFRVQNGATTQIVDFSGTTAPGATLHAIKIEVSGSTVKVSRGGTLLGAASISGLLTGRVGVGSRNDAANFDNLKVVQP
jgi:hypothetical protein